MFHPIHPPLFNLPKLLEARSEKVFKQACLSLSSFLSHLSTKISTTSRQQTQPIIKMSDSNSNSGDHAMTSDNEALSSVSLSSPSLFDLQGVVLLPHVLSPSPPQLGRYLRKPHSDCQQPPSSEIAALSLPTPTKTIPKKVTPKKVTPKKRKIEAAEGGSEGEGEDETPKIKAKTKPKVKTEPKSKATPKGSKTSSDDFTGM